jgi:hypothetical protein
MKIRVNTGLHLGGPSPLWVLTFCRFGYIFRERCEHPRSPAGWCHTCQNWGHA